MKMIYDDDGLIIGVGETEREARQDAEKFIRNDLWYIEEIVAEMRCADATDALVAEVEMTCSGDVSWVRLPDGRIGLPREASARPTG